MQLLQFDPAWDVQAMATLAGKVLAVKSVGSVGLSAFEELPVLHEGARCAAGKRQVFELARELTGIDSGLTASQKADAAAYLALIHTTLGPVETWALWGDADTFANLTRVPVSQQLKAPFRWFYPGLMRKRYIAQLEAHGFHDGDWAATVASRAYSALEGRLASSRTPYLLDTAAPTAVDVALYAHLQRVRLTPTIGRLVAASHPGLVKHHASVAAAVAAAAGKASKSHKSGEAAEEENAWVAALRAVDAASWQREAASDSTGDSGRPSGAATPVDGAAAPPLPAAFGASASLVSAGLWRIPDRKETVVVDAIVKIGFLAVSILLVRGIIKGSKA